MPIPIKIQQKSFVVPESGDPCELWIGYYKQLKKHTGTNNARMLWLVTWKSNGDASCATNPRFHRWLRKNRIDVSNAATRTMADISSIGSNVMGLGKNLSGFLSLGVPITLGFLLIIIGIVLWNTSKKADVTDLAMLSPVGRGASALKLLQK